MITYNRIVLRPISAASQLLLILLAVLIISSLACGSNQNSEIAVREAVRQHLAARGNLNMGKMTLSVDSITFEQDQATASVTIAAREDPNAKMQMVYQLTQSGSEWKVQAPEDSSQPAHGGMDGGMGGSARELPPGHPSTGGQTPEPESTLPQGHPPIPAQ